MQGVKKLTTFAVMSIEREKIHRLYTIVRPYPMSTTCYWSSDEVKKQRHPGSCIEWLRSKWNQETTAHSDSTPTQDQIQQELTKKPFQLRRRSEEVIKVD